MRIALAVLALAACTSTRTVTEDLGVPTYTSPCALGETCADGTDVDPEHDHVEQWKALDCAEACALLLPSDRTVLACQPMKLVAGTWLVECTFTLEVEEGNGELL